MASAATDKPLVFKNFLRDVVMTIVFSAENPRLKPEVSGE
jgi:hypothetical protein